MQLMYFKFNYKNITIPNQFRVHLTTLRAPSVVGVTPFEKYCLREMVWEVNWIPLAQNGTRRGMLCTLG